MAAATETHRSEVLPSHFLSAIRRILAGADLPEALPEVTPLAAGGNNRVYLVCAGDSSYVAKWYYNDAAVFRERMRAEYEFITHARRFGIDCVPSAIGCDPSLQLAVYERIPGVRLVPEKVTATWVIEAARFFAQLNASAVRMAGTHLQPASDACFSVMEHVESVDRRMERLSGLDAQTQLDHRAADLISKLGRTWETVKQNLTCEDGPDALPDNWRCLSPSDFGFHNALLREDGVLCFLDFEYAGWDDPAKMIGDFFSHPGVTAPAEHLESFINVALEPFADAKGIAARARRLMKVAGIRWCCIVLNDFLPQVASRRQFADPGSNPEDRKRRQLAKAEHMLSKIIS